MTLCVCPPVHIYMYNNNTPIIREINIVSVINMLTYHNVDLEQHNIYVYLLILLSTLWLMDQGFIPQSPRSSIILESVANDTSEIWMSL